MLTPALVRRLRRIGLWSAAQALHGRLAPPVCAGVHRLVMTLGRRGLLPKDLLLKHIYDYEVVYVDPRLIDTTLKVGEWNRREPDHPESRWTRFRRWQRLGGGWKTLRRHLSRNLHGRFVIDGDWDLRARPLTLHSVILELFREGRPVSETSEYGRLREYIEAGRFEWARGCTTIEDLDRYYANLVDAYEQIRTTGYRTQRELGNDGSDEIRICVGRHGSLCVFGGGTHRLAIARVLDLERIPVLVKRVHATWAIELVERTGADLVQALDHGFRELAAQKAVSTRD